MAILRTSTKTHNPLFCLKLTRIRIRNPINTQYKLGEKKNLMHFVLTFSEVYFVAFSWYRKKRQKIQGISSPKLMFSGVK